MKEATTINEIVIREHTTTTNDFVTRIKLINTRTSNKGCYYKLSIKVDVNDKGPNWGMEHRFNGIGSFKAANRVFDSCVENGVCLY